MMSYRSIDTLQKALSEKVFAHTKDSKKAAGRALGTLIEIITYYLLKEWGLSDHISIERKLAEYGNSSITHNVEFTLHPIIQKDTLSIIRPYAAIFPSTSLRLRSGSMSFRRKASRFKP